MQGPQNTEIKRICAFLLWLLLPCCTGKSESSVVMFLTDKFSEWNKRTYFHTFCFLHLSLFLTLFFCFPLSFFCLFLFLVTLVHFLGITPLPPPALHHNNLHHHYPYYDYHHLPSSFTFSFGLICFFLSVGCISVHTNMHTHTYIHTHTHYDHTLIKYTSNRATSPRAVSYDYFFFPLLLSLSL